MPHVCGIFDIRKNIDLLGNKLESQRGKEPTNRHALTGSIEYLKIEKKTPLKPPQNIVYPVENTQSVPSTSPPLSFLVSETGTKEEKDYRRRRASLSDSRRQRISSTLTIRCERK
jgi:hypothetical protein